MTATAEAERTEVQTRDRIVDAAAQHVLACALHDGFKDLARHAKELAKRVWSHEAGAVDTLRAGHQTMLFDDAAEATMAAEGELLDALEAALQAAHEHYDPADYED